MQVKNRLRKILDERGIKQNFVAEKAGITRQTFSNLVNNRFNPSLELAFKICMVLEMSLDDVFYYE
jgi:putative transcriptional regulator